MNNEYTETSYVCPITKGQLLLMGSSAYGSDPYYYYISNADSRVKYRRSNSVWNIMEYYTGNINRYFQVDGDVFDEVKLVGDKWMSINSTEDEIQLVLSEWKNRLEWRSGNYTMPHTIKPPTTTGLDTLISVQPMAAPSGMLFYFDYKYGKGEEDSLVNRNIKPNITKEDTYLADYITGLSRVVDVESLQKERELFSEDINIGDEIYAWDISGEALSMREGELVVRNKNKFITAKLLRMS